MAPRNPSKQPMTAAAPQSVRTDAAERDEPSVTTSKMRVSKAPASPEDAGLQLHLQPKLSFPSRANSLRTFFFRIPT